MFLFYAKKAKKKPKNCYKELIRRKISKTIYLLILEAFKTISKKLLQIIYFIEINNFNNSCLKMFFY